MLIKLAYSSMRINKHSCGRVARKEIEKYLKDAAGKKHIELKITPDYYHIESIQRTLYEVLYSLSINYDIELM